MLKTKLNFLLFFSICFLFASQSYAQKLVVNSAVVNYEDQQRDCISVQVEPKPKKVKKELDDWFDDKKDIELKGIGFLRNKDVLYAEKVSIPEISSNKMDLYIKVVESDWGSHICVFGSFGYNIHITPKTYPQEYKALKNMTLDFLSDYLPDFYKDRIEASEEAVNDLTNERTKMSEQIIENREQIAELLSENEELTKEIKKKKMELEKTEKTLKSQEAKLKSVNQKLGEGNNK